MQSWHHAWLIFLHGLVWVSYIGSWVVFPDLLWLDATLPSIFETQLLLSVRSPLFCLYTGDVFALSDLALYQQVPPPANSHHRFHFRHNLCTGFVVYNVSYMYCIIFFLQLQILSKILYFQKTLFHKGCNNYKYMKRIMWQITERKKNPKIIYFQYDFYHGAVDQTLIPRKEPSLPKRFLLSLVRI